MRSKLEDQNAKLQKTIRERKQLEKRIDKIISYVEKKEATKKVDEPKVRPWMYLMEEIENT